MIVPWTLTGVPLSKVGVKRARMAASFAAESNIGLPESACAEITLPCSLTRIWTLTGPCALTCLAIIGYAGAGMVITVAIRTPVETCRGGSFTTGGVGGASSTLTTGAGPLQVMQPVELVGAALGGSTLRLLRTAPTVIGGTSPALTPIRSGILFGSSVRETKSVRSGLCAVLSTGAFDAGGRRIGCVGRTGSGMARITGGTQSTTLKSSV